METEHDKLCRYYVEVLKLYGNIPQLREYLLFFRLEEMDIESYEKGVNILEPLKLIA